jgi:hypothetical protein
MAERSKKITELNALTNMPGTDLLLTVNQPGTSNVETKKITLSNLCANINPTTTFTGSVSTRGALTVNNSTSTGNIVISSTANLIVNATATFTNTVTFSNTVTYNQIEANTLTLTGNTQIVANGALITSVDAITVGGNTPATLLAASDTAYTNAVANAVSLANDAYTNAVANAVYLSDTAYSNAVTVSGTNSDTAYTNAVANAVYLSDTAYSNAVTVSGTNSDTAYTNAIAIAANADNITSGTLTTSLLPATANVSTAVNVGANVNLTVSSINVGNSTVNTVANSTSLNTTKIFLSTSDAPSSNTDTGTLGEIRIDTNYIYVCVATDTWKRVTLSNWGGV